MLVARLAPDAAPPAALRSQPTFDIFALGLDDIVRHAIAGNARANADAIKLRSLVGDHSRIGLARQERGALELEFIETTIRNSNVDNAWKGSWRELIEIPSFSRDMLSQLDEADAARALRAFSALADADPEFRLAYMRNQFFFTYHPLPEIVAVLAQIRRHPALASEVSRVLDIDRPSMRDQSNAGEPRASAARVGAADLR